MRYGFCALWLVLPAALLVGPTALADPARNEGQELLDEIRAERAALDVERRALQAELEHARRELSDTRSVAADRAGFGELVSVSADETASSVVSFGSNIVVAGTVLGDATAFGGDILVRSSGQVEGDAVAFGGRVIVQDGGRLVGEQVSAWGPSQSTERAPSALGSLTHYTDASSLLSILYRRVVLMLALGGAGILALSLFPERVARTMAVVETRPLRSLAVGGFMLSFVLSFSALLAVVTLGIGLPASGVLLALLGVAWLLGVVGLCQVLGERLPVGDRLVGRWAPFAAGLVLLTCVSGLPLVGFIVVATASSLAVGSATLSHLGRR